MSYCKVILGGKDRGIKFNNLALLIMSEKTDKDFPDQTAAYAMVYGGLRGNSYAKQEEPDYTFEDVIDWVDKMTTEDANVIAAAFQQSEAYKKTEAYLQSVETSKKKTKPKKVISGASV